jgi:hypothetical protein
VIFGPDELKIHAVQLKNLTTGAAVQVARQDLMNVLRKAIASPDPLVSVPSLPNSQPPVRVSGAGSFSVSVVAGSPSFPSCPMCGSDACCRS